MDVREILDNNRQLIMRNIVPCDELYAALVKHGVMSESMCEDAKVRNSTQSLYAITVCNNYAQYTITVPDNCIQ